MSESGTALADRIEAALAGEPAIAAARGQATLSLEGIWVVGGAVRDALRGERPAEIDLAVAGDAGRLARALARAADAHAFELAETPPAWRVASHEGERLADVAALRGPTIEEDLAGRDFTVNAIAVPLSGGEPIDPAGGIADLEAGLLRAVSSRSFADDPLRIMRAARLAAGLGLRVEPGTVELARASARRAAEPAGERQFAELAGMLSGPDPVRALELLGELGATPAVLPELEALRGIRQGPNHHLDVHGHTIEVLRRTLEVEADLERFAGRIAPRVEELLDLPLADGLTRRAGLRFAAVLHDIAKPPTRVERDGFVSFLGHDRLGAEMVLELCERLRTSRRTAEYIAALTRDHLILGFMVAEQPLPRRRVWEYLRATEPWSIDVTLLTVADRLAAQGGGVPAEVIEAHLELAREMLGVALAWERHGPPEPLWRGDELAAELGIDPGPELGDLLRELEAAQFAGEISDRGSALEHAREVRHHR